MGAVKISLTLLVVAFVSSCSVKEDRSICPCNLLLDFSQVQTDLSDGVELYISSDEEQVFSGRIDLSEDSLEFLLQVPRGRFDLTVYSGTEMCPTSREGMDIPVGNECPRVYMHTSEIDAECESAREEIDMQKNYCMMHIYVTQESDVQIDVSLSGNVSGYSGDGSPIEGEFRCGLLLDDTGGCVASVPRQVDGSLMLEIDDGSGAARSFALGEFILACGYDWTTPDLKDINVGIDYILSQINVFVEGWDGVYEYNMLL